MGVVIEVREQHDAVQFRPVDSAEGAFSEAWLQETLRRYPEVLPVEEFGPVFHPLVPIGREVPTSAGSIDNLFISHAGYLVIAETKLWRNPEAKREVVAQLIDYATALTRLTYDEIDALTKDYLQKYEATSSSLQEWVETRLDPVDSGFQRRVSRNLRLGRFLLLIVTDQERPTVVDMLKRVNAHAWLSIDMAVVELRPFRRANDSKEGVLLVPYVAGRTEIVQRSIVEVTVIGTPDAEITVRQEGYQDEEVRRRRGPLISEASFWDLMDVHAPEVKGAGRRLIDAFRSEEEFGLALRETSIVVEASIPGRDVAVSLFFLKSNGKLVFWPGTVRRRLREAGLPESLADEYVTEMHAILGASQTRHEPSRKVDEVDLERLCDVAKRFVKKVEEAAS
jgi:hypothetical protein